MTDKKTFIINGKTMQLTRKELKEEIMRNFKRVSKEIPIPEIEKKKVLSVLDNYLDLLTDLIFMAGSGITVEGIGVIMGFVDFCLKNVIDILKDYGKDNPSVFAETYLKIMMWRNFTNKFLNAIVKPITLIQDDKEPEEGEEF